MLIKLFLDNYEQTLSSMIVQEFYVQKLIFRIVEEFTWLEENVLHLIARIIVYCWTIYDPL